MSTEAELSAYIDAEGGVFSRKTADLIQDYGSSIEALLYGELFVPEFIEVDGSIILKNNIANAAQGFAAAKAEQNMPLQKLGGVVQSG